MRDGGQRGLWCTVFGMCAVVGYGLYKRYTDRNSIFKEPYWFAKEPSPKDVYWFVEYNGTNSLSLRKTKWLPKGQSLLEWLCQRNYTEAAVRLIELKRDELAKDFSQKCSVDDIRKLFYHAILTDHHDVASAILDSVGDREGMYGAVLFPDVSRAIYDKVHSGPAFGVPLLAVEKMKQNENDLFAQKRAQFLINESGAMGFDLRREPLFMDNIGENIALRLALTKYGSRK